MMRKTCILITCDYPYDTGEPFLENEMSFLSRSFDKIYIFPLNAHQYDKPTRRNPENSEVHPVGCVHNTFRIPIYAAKGLFSSNKALKTGTGVFKYDFVNLYACGRSEYIKNFILKFLRNKKIDCNNAVIYSYWFTDQAIAAWKLKDELSKNFTSVKAVCRAHGYDLYWDRNNAGYLPYQDISLSKLDGVYPCSDDGRKYLEEKYPGFADKLHTARLGTFDYGVAPIPRGKIFVTCCSLKRFKRISLFAEAFCRLAKERNDCYWYCIGDGEELDSIKSIISKHNADKNVKLLGRFSNKDVLKFYKKTEVSYFVNVSTSEGVPVSIMEAMSFGIPVIATDVGGTGELVNSLNGVILAPDINADQLSEAISKEIQTDDRNYHLKRREARKTWERLSSADINYTEWCKLLTD